MRQKFVLAHDEARRRAMDAVRTAPAGQVVEVKPPTRSLLANAKMWAMLEDLAKQIDWYGQKLTKEDWKTMCSASVKKQRVVPGIDGGFVVMGDSTRDMTVAEMAELITFIEAFGAQQGVTFHDECTEPA